jgi:hypothetical protein
VDNSKETLIAFLELGIKRYTELSRTKYYKGRWDMAYSYGADAGLCRYVNEAYCNRKIGKVIRDLLKSAIMEVARQLYAEGHSDNPRWLGIHDHSTKHFKIRLKVLSSILKEIKKLPDWETMTA